MIFEVPTVKSVAKPHNYRIDFAILIGVILTVSCGLSLLMMQARNQTYASMKRICYLIKSNRTKDALSDSHLFAPSVAKRLGPLFAKLGVVKVAKYGIESCEVTGRPCVVRLELGSDSSTAEVLLYFYGGTCLETEGMQRRPMDQHGSR